YGRVVADLEYRADCVSSATRLVLRSRGEGDRGNGASDAVRSTARCSGSLARRHPDCDDVRTVAPRNQPQQDRRLPRRLPGNGGNGLRKPGFAHRGVDRVKRSLTAEPIGYGADRTSGVLALIRRICRSLHRGETDFGEIVPVSARLFIL